MPLVKATLQSQLVTIFNDKNNTAQQAAAKIADAVDAYIKSATVTVTGTCATPSGAGTIAGTGTIT